MFSVRITTKWHGNTNMNVLYVNLIITGLLVWFHGIDYLTIFCTSSFLHLIIESGLSLAGIRKGKVFVYGKKLPRVADIFLRSLVEGPAFCVPAFFTADQFMADNLVHSSLMAIGVVGLASLYMGLSDRSNLKRLGPNESPIFSRRAMTKPGAVMLLALLNTICVVAVMLIPDTYKSHAITYLLSYSGLVMLFYLINYSLGVRIIQFYDSEKGEFVKPGIGVQAAGLTYDSAYEMALLISPAYWVAHYCGLFEYSTI